MFSGASKALAQEAGVLGCVWTGDRTVDDYTSVMVQVSSDRAAGLDDIAGRLARGGTSLGVGDTSAVTCRENFDYGCSAYVVAGPYWFELFPSGQLRDGTDPQQLTSRLAEQLADVLLDAGPPAPGWTMPPNSWVPVTDCDTFETPTSMSDLVGSPGLTLVGAEDKGMSGIYTAVVRGYYACGWWLPNGGDGSPGQISEIGVSLLPGARWAYEDAAVSSDGTPAEVPGAQEAVYSCTTGVEGRCSLDVLTDDSWLHVSLPPDQPQEQALIDVAAAIIAAHGS